MTLTEESLIADISGLRDTIKYCEYRIAQKFFVLEAMSFKRRGKFVPFEVATKVVDIVSLLARQTEVKTARERFDLFLQKVDCGAFRMADAIRFIGPAFSPLTIRKMIQMDAKMGYLVRRSHGRYAVNSEARTIISSIIPSP